MTRWTPFIFGYVMLGLQIGLRRFLAPGNAAPNFGLIAVIFIALHSRRDGALLGGFTVGFVQDLLTEQSLGLYAFSYGLVALVVLSTYKLLPRNHPLSLAGLGLAAGFLTMVVVLLHSFVHPAGPAATDGKIILPRMRISAGAEFASIFFTAFMAPVVIIGLEKGKRMLTGIDANRRRN